MAWETMYVEKQQRCFRLQTLHSITRVDLQNEELS